MLIFLRCKAQTRHNVPELIKANLQETEWSFADPFQIIAK